MSASGLPEATFPWMNRADPDQYRFLWDPVMRILGREAVSLPKRIFNLGCGNGLTAEMLIKNGFEIVGIDPLTDAVTFAKERCPQAHFEVASGHDDLQSAVAFGADANARPPHKSEALKTALPLRESIRVSKLEAEA